MTYSIPIRDMAWSKVFRLMEFDKKTLQIEDYSVNQNSLEQVVLTLFKDQKTRQNVEFDD